KVLIDYFNCMNSVGVFQIGYGNIPGAAMVLAGVIDETMRSARLGIDPIRIALLVAAKATSRDPTATRCIYVCTSTITMRMSTTGITMADDSVRFIFKVTMFTPATAKYREAILVVLEGAQVRLVYFACAHLIDKRM